MKILIIEDDKNIVEAISIAFQLSWPGTEVISTPFGEKGVDLVETERVDTAIIDLGLPDINGFEVLKQIRLFSDVPVIILTVTSDEAYIVKALELGADDYLVKPITQLQLLARVKNVLRRKSNLEEIPINHGSLRLEPSMAQVFYHDKELHLTPTEYRILHYLLQQKGHIVSNSTLIKAIWDDDDVGFNDCIKVNIRNLRRKIEADPAHPKIILTKQGMGHLIAQFEDNTELSRDISSKV
jgi:two-component system response regulator VicR